MIPLALSMGLYQSYLSVAITLILLYLMTQLLDGASFKTSFYRGLKGIGMILGAGVLYFIAMKIICHATALSLQSGDYNSIDTILSMSLPEILLTTIKGGARTVSRFLTATSVYPDALIVVLHVAMIAVAGIVILCRVFQKEIGVKEKVLFFVLLLLLPIGMNVVYPLTGGMSHDVMEFGIWLIYLFVLLIVWQAFSYFKENNALLKNGLRWVSAALVFVALWGNVQTANTAYMKKDLEQQATLSLLTRIVYQMETHDAYVTGETPVVFVGTPDGLTDTISGLESVSNITGCWHPYSINGNARDRYRAYFDYVLANPAKMADADTWLQMQEDLRVAEMPTYPAEGSMALMDGVFVIKVG